MPRAFRALVFLLERLKSLLFQHDAGMAGRVEWRVKSTLDLWRGESRVTSCLPTLTFEVKRVIGQLQRQEVRRVRVLLADAPTGSHQLLLLRLLLLLDPSTPSTCDITLSMAQPPGVDHSRGGP